MSEGNCIFINYRRDDTRAIVGRISDHLMARFGRDGVFMDIDGIPVGIDFRSHIKQVTQRCDAFLVLIGSAWLSCGRLSNDDDWVRIEIEAALARVGAIVIPILVDDASMPSAESLPPGIRDLAYRNAFHIDTGKDFGHHMSQLIHALECNARHKHSDYSSTSGEVEPKVNVHQGLPEGAISIMSPRSLEIGGMSTHALIEGLINMDYDVLDGAVEADVGTVERWKPIVENNPDGMRVAVTGEGTIAGYWHFLPLEDLVFERARAGTLDDGLVVLDDINMMGPPGVYNLYFMIIAVVKKYRGVSLLRRLLDAFVDTLADLAQMGIFFPEMVAWAYSVEGDAMCRSLKMNQIATHYKKGKIYSLDLRRCPRQLFYRDRLMALYRHAYSQDEHKNV